MINQEELKKLYTYEPETGLFIRNTQPPGSRFKIGTIAGSVNDDYIKIKIHKKMYKAHRLAFLYMRGYYPNKVDHKNHNCHDNRWDNLRDVVHGENMKNKKKYKNNTTGTMGVTWFKARNKWGASISVDKTSVFLGLFINYHEAVNARKNAEVLYGFHENHGGDYE